VDAVAVDDGVDVERADVPLLAEQRLEPADGLTEQLVRRRPEHRRPHLAGHRAEVPGEEPLVLERVVDRFDERLAVEEATDGDLDPRLAPLELELADFAVELLPVALEHPDHVRAVVGLADVKEAVVVLGGAAGLDHVGRRLLPDVADAGVDVLEELRLDDVQPQLGHRLVAEIPLLLEAVGQLCAADDGHALVADPAGLPAEPEAVVHHDDVRPVDVGAPVVGLRDDSVTDVVRELVVGDGVSHVVAPPLDPPRDIPDEAVQGDEQEVSAAHHSAMGCQIGR